MIYSHLCDILTGEIQSNDISDYVDLLRCLQDRADIEGLPPGGGLQSKYERISILNYLVRETNFLCSSTQISYYRAHIQGGVSG